MNLIKLKTPEEQKKILENKPVLKYLYEEWYKLIKLQLFSSNGINLEIGSGAGNIKHYMKNVITSDIIHNKWQSLTLNAEFFPFKNKSINNIIMIDVLHHMERPEIYLNEAFRVLKPKGKIILMEPYSSAFSFLFYKYFHHEPFNLNQNILRKPYQFKAPNQAASQIIFKNEKSVFIEKFSGQLTIKKFKLLSTIIYPLSGGYKHYSLIPMYLLLPFKAMEIILYPFKKFFSFRSLIVIEKL